MKAKIINKPITRYEQSTLPFCFQTGSGLDSHEYLRKPIEQQSARLLWQNDQLKTQVEACSMLVEKSLEWDHQLHFSTG